MSLRKVSGLVLIFLMFISTFLAILGIWGMVENDTMWKLLSTFFVIGGATVGLTYVADVFFGKQGETKQEKVNP